MEIIKRRFMGKMCEFPVYKQEESPYPCVYWKDAKEHDWAYTDDGYVAKCIKRTEYEVKDGRVKTEVKLTCGVQWVSKNSKLLYEPNRAAGIYTMVKPQRWQKRELKKNRTQNVVDAYVGQLLTGQKPDWNQLGKVYRPDQKAPAATVKRLFKEKVVKDMVSEKLKEIMASKGIDKGFVLDTILKAIDIAEEKQDVSNMLRAAENFVEMLEMKPNKKVTTDTLQIDMTNQIMDQIETEEKKMVASRKTEELTNEAD